MSKVNLSNWAVVSPKDDTGFGRQAESLKQVLAVGWHFIVPSDHMQNKPPSGLREIILPADASDDILRQLLRKVDGIIFFERPGWHPSLLPICGELQLPSLCCPNWEWFRAEDPRWRHCSKFICTSAFTEQIIRRHGFSNTVQIGPWPIEPDHFPGRHITGPARHFVHNAGLVDQQDRKGTRDTIRAFQRTKRSDIRLTVRLQREVPLPTGDSRITIEVGNFKNPADLYRSGDVAIQPSKMEGVGFMVIEPVLCGIPTLTLDYPPMNECVTDPRMLVRKKWFARRAFPTTWVKHAHLRLPSQRHLTNRIDWCAENPLDDISETNLRWRSQATDTTRIHRVWQQATRNLLST
ncbi:MAG: hypothetical protein SynsKO_12990 [Synoicihabitans sp.]